MRQLGEGSFSVVEECMLHGQGVAVKRLRPELFRDLEEIKGFVTEGMTLAELEHPCVTTLSHTPAYQRHHPHPSSLKSSTDARLPRAQLSTTYQRFRLF